MNYLSRFLHALSPACAVLVAGAAALGSGHSASAATPSFSGAKSPRAALPSLSRDAFVRVGVATAPIELSTDLTKIGGFSNLLGSTTPSPSGFHLVQAPQNVTVGFQSANVSVTEGVNPSVILTVTRTGDTSVSTTVNFATANGAATEPADYSKSSGFITFAPGQTSRQISISITNDNLPENAESFTVTLSNAQNSPATNTAPTISVPTATVQITDDDSSIQFESTINAVNESANTASIRVSRDGSASKATTLTYSIADGTAKAGQDYTPITPGPTRTINFAAGETSKDITVPIINDSLDEADETFTLTIEGASQDALGNNKTTTVTIVDNDETQVGFSTATNTTNEGVGTFSVTVTRPDIATNDISRAITVDYETADGSALQPQDYTFSKGTLTFDANVRTQTIEVPIIDDNVAENTETFQIKLSNPQFVTQPEVEITASISPVATTTVSIRDNDAQVNFNVTSYTVDESVGKLSVSVSRQLNLDSPATVDYATSNITAIAGQDYTATSGTLSFAANEVTKLIEVPIIDDSSDENSESFRIRLFNPSPGTSVGQQSATTITITDNDDIPTITVADVSQNEGDEGQTNMSFVVTLSAPSGRTIAVNYATSNGSATTADQDYVGTSNQIRFDVDAASGLGPKTRTINVVINGDKKYEDNETFVLSLLSASNATLVTRKAIGTIVNDDAIPKTTFNFEPVKPSVAENDPTGFANVTIVRSGDTSSAASVTASTVDGTAIGGADYTPVSTVVTFDANQTSKVVKIPIQDESVTESDETFQVALSAPSASVGTATLGANSTATVTIVNDDATPTLNIEPASVLEGNSGTSDLVFRAKLSFATPAGSSEQTITVQYATADGTATVADNDYQATSGTLTFEPGETEKTIVVKVNGDEKMPIESNETLSLVLSNAQNVTLSSTSVTGTILNDDTPPTFSNFAFTPITKSVGEADGKVTLVVTRSSGADRVATINYATANGTATAGLDYTAKTGTLIFPVGVTTANIEVPIINDTLQETGAAETFTVTLSNPGGNGVQPTQKTATVSIIDNEGAPALSIANAQVVEGDSGVTAMPFTVTLFPQSKNTVKVNVATVQRTGAGAATSGQDYAARAATLTFAPGQATQTFIVYVAGNKIVEDDETFNVQLSAPQGAPIATGKSLAVGTILNDDEPGGGGTISFLSASYSVNENVQDETATPSNSVRITLGRSGRVDDINAQSATVRFTTGVGTATANQDYRPVNQVVTFPAGQTMVSVIIPIIDDTIFENDETVPLTISSPSDNAILGSITTASLTITDNDPRSLVPRAEAISPSNASGSPFTVKSTYSTDNLSGVSDLSPVLIQYGGNIYGGGFRALYDAKTNLLSINPTTGQGVRPGTRAILTNQYGSLDASQTTVTRSGNTLTVTWRISLTSKVALYAYSGATSASSGQSVFIKRGTWQPPTTTTSSTNGS